MSKKKIFRNSSFYMLAGFLPSAVGIITLPLFSRYLSPEEYGVLALIQTMSAFLPLILTLQIPSSLRRFYFDFEGDELKSYTSTLFLLVTVGGGLVAYLLNLYLSEAVEVIFPQSSEGYVGFFHIGLLIAFVNTLGSFNGLLLRVRQQPKAYMTVALIAFFTALAVNLILVTGFQWGARGMLIGQLAGGSVALAGYLLQNIGQFCLKLKPSILKGSIIYALPLIPSALTNNTYFYSDRIILDRHVSLGLIGLYGFSGRIAWTFKKLVNEFNEAFLPHFMKTALKDKHTATREAAHVADIFLFLLSLALAFVALFSFEILGFFFDPRYLGAWFMVPVLCSAYFFRSVYCFSVAGILFSKKTKFMPMITATAAVVSILLNVLLIPRFGVMAAAWVMVASFFVSSILASLWSRHTLFIPLRYGRILIYYSFFLLALWGGWSIHRTESIFTEWNFNSLFILKFCILLPGLALTWFHRRDFFVLMRKFASRKNREEKSTRSLLD
ncbi:oligosaccharide flippase family protein [Akkermansiaceae bacterium]|nr:oligosaccharide flippase family protein [Akkermansiaceae bacterium]MDA7875346.1 oligosaccharide flippase family protein [Akkermansiaceae bacterium]MDC0301389.1 oligosaccharide flippase family protein [Akkermansiaceae bacterium]